MGASAAFGAHRNRVGELRKREELPPTESHLSIDLIGDDGQLMPLRNGDERMQVALRVDGAAGVGGVVDHNGSRAVIHKRLQLRGVRLPILFGQQVIKLDPSADGLCQHLVERKAGPGHEQVVAFVEHACDRYLQRARASARDHDVVHRVCTILA